MLGCRGIGHPPTNVGSWPGAVSLWGRSFNPDDLTGVMLIDSLERALQDERVAYSQFIGEAREVCTPQRGKVSFGDGVSTTPHRGTRARRFTMP